MSLLLFLCTCSTSFLLLKDVLHLLLLFSDLVQPNESAFGLDVALYKFPLIVTREEVGVVSEEFLSKYPGLQCSFVFSKTALRFHVPNKL